MSNPQTSFSESDASHFHRQLVTSRSETLESFKLLKSRWNALKPVWRDRHKQTFEPKIEKLFSQWEKSLTSFEDYALSVNSQIKISESLVDINALLNSLSGGVQSSASNTQSQQNSVQGQTGKTGTSDAENGLADSAVDESKALASQFLATIQQSMQLMQAKSATGLQVAVVVFTLVNPLIASAMPPSTPQPAPQPDSSAASNSALANQCNIDDAPVLPENSEMIRETRKNLDDLDGYPDTKKKRRKEEDDNDLQTMASQPN